MDFSQLTNTCALQSGKSFNQHANFNGKWSSVLDLNKSDHETKTKQPITLSELIRPWDTNRNRFSPRNVREISSSVYGRTRLGQLHFLSKTEERRAAIWAHSAYIHSRQDNSVLDVELLEDDGHYPETTSSSHCCQSSLNPSFLKIKPAVL